MIFCILSTNSDIDTESETKISSNSAKRKLQATKWYVQVREEMRVCACQSQPNQPSQSQNHINDHFIIVKIFKSSSCLVLCCCSFCLFFATCARMHLLQQLADLLFMHVSTTLIGYIFIGLVLTMQHCFIFFLFMTTVHLNVLVFFSGVSWKQRVSHRVWAQPGIVQGSFCCFIRFLLSLYLSHTVLYSFPLLLLSST